MDKREILQKIIDNGGDCEVLHANAATRDHMCKSCPMSKLTTRPDGSYHSCWDSIVFIEQGDQPDYRFVEELYLEKAINLLQDILIEDMLKGEDLSAEETRRDSGQDN